MNNYKIGSAENLLGVSFRHRTNTLEDAYSIVGDGFDLKRTGATAKKHNAPKDLIKHDPLALFAFKKGAPGIEPGTGYVDFKVKPDSRILWHNLEGHEIKALLYSKLNATSQVDLTNKLLSFGVDAICSEKFDTEIVVLNTDSLRWSEFGVTEGVSFPLERNEQALDDIAGPDEPEKSRPRVR